MIERRPFNRLGGADHGWLKANHHFSFADYRDPQRMGWGILRVWNDDEIASNSGFPPHPHANMEIVTYVRSGAVTHKDSLGNTGRTEAGDVQVMSAGSGIRHSEYNFEQETTTLFQIWIEPRTTGGQPAWGTKPFPRGDRSGQFVTLASGFAEDADALPIRADARVLGAVLNAGQRVEYKSGARRHLYLVPATGAVEINGVRIDARDGAAVVGEAVVEIAALEDSGNRIGRRRVTAASRRVSGRRLPVIPATAQRRAGFHGFVRYGFYISAPSQPISILYVRLRHISACRIPSGPDGRTRRRAEGEWEWVTNMRMPGPYIDDSWDWLPHTTEKADTGQTKAAYAVRKAVNDNSPGHVLCELGLVLLVPLAGAALVELVLGALQIY